MAVVQADKPDALVKGGNNNGITPEVVTDLQNGGNGSLRGKNNHAK